MKNGYLRYYLSILAKLLLCGMLLPCVMITGLSAKEKNTSAYANTTLKAITGKVTSEDEKGGMPGVNVIVKGTTTGTVTDVDGNYSIDAPDGAVLIFSSIGY